MSEISPRHKVAILRVLRDAAAPLSSAEIADRIAGYGLDLSPRTVRLCLQRMARAGWVAAAKRGRHGGQAITPGGVLEVEGTVTLDRLGFTAARVDTLAWQMDYDVERGEGRIVLNVTLISRANLLHAVREMTVVFRAGLGMGRYVALFAPGERVGTLTVPESQVGIGTICSVTVNGVLLGRRIPALARFGGLLEMADRRPARFTELIAYEGTTLDPLEVFIKARLTDVHGAAITGNGRVGASFDRLRERELDGILVIGKPNRPLFDLPVAQGRTGMVILGGLNPAAAIEEAGIPTSNRALCALCDFKRLIHYRDLQAAALELVER
ncbi:MAG: Ribonuclease R winged-helix domain protein [Lentisphaerae bacterium ADurb.BinA184]|nr:MAG: Ribonuclease R winged-helix domain protein [Lentisphaerae bacterium ADurb.BinA184]